MHVLLLCEHYFGTRLITFDYDEHELIQIYTEISSINLYLEIYQSIFYHFNTHPECIYTVSGNSWYIVEEVFSGLYNYSKLRCSPTTWTPDGPGVLLDFRRVVF